MFQCVQIIAKCCQVRDLQRNQVDVGGHRTGNLLGGVSIFIDVAKDFIAVIFWWLWRLIVVFKRLFPSGFPVCVDFLHQFLRVVLRGRWDRGLYSLFRVGVGLDVGPVYENRLGGQISRFRHLFQYPRKDLVHGFCGKPMTEIITHRGKMRRFRMLYTLYKPLTYYLLFCPVGVSGRRYTLPERS